MNLRPPFGAIQAVGHKRLHAGGRAECKTEPTITSEEKEPSIANHASPETFLPTTLKRKSRLLFFERNRSSYRHSFTRPRCLISESQTVASARLFPCPGTEAVCSHPVHTWLGLRVSVVKPTREPVREGKTWRSGAKQPSRSSYISCLPILPPMEIHSQFFNQSISRFINFIEETYQH